MQIKLSDKQKEVIAKMRKGESLTTHKFIGYSTVTIGASAFPFVNKNTFNGLFKRGLIYFASKDNHSTSNYQLTELGKTIEL